MRISSVYHFLKLSESRVAELAAALEALAAAAGLRGLCLLGPEGLNGTFSGSEEAVTELKTLLRRELGDLIFKDSRAAKPPFREFKVKIKEEIVTLGRPDLAPAPGTRAHLSPAEWQAALADPDVVVIDTRNDYEVEIGKFRGAVDLATREFREFPEAVRRSGIPKDKKVLMYCTGGIRCEKAYLAMREQGYENVLQLEGGILNYLEQFPGRDFEGECFVFDYRVAVDQKLAPTARYRLCPHCGRAADQALACELCATETLICRHCSIAGVKTCSKNCAHHAELGSRSSRPPAPRSTP